MPVSVKVGGAWKTATNVYNKVGGVWKTAADMPVKVGGVWKTGVLIQGAYESIATVSGTGSSTSLTFSSIPSTYSHLQIRAINKNIFNSNSTGLLRIQFNSDTNTNYSMHRLFGNGTSVTASAVASDNYIAAAYTLSSGTSQTNVMAAQIWDIHDYASTTKYKTIRMISGINYNGGTTSEYIALISGNWRSTNAINSITITDTTGNFTTSTQFALYGIKGA